MRTMKAIQIHRYKNADDFTPREVPIPEIKAGEILVRVQYAGINPSDLANMQGYYPDHTILPRIIGRDFAGNVVEGRSSLLGKTVMGSGGDVGFTRDGSFAEYLAVPEEGVVEVPTGLDLTHAATMGVPFLAALSCLNRFPRDLQGKSMLLIGGAGVVGSAATVIAQERGARVVRTILRSSDVDSLAPLLQEGVFMDLGKNGDMIAQTAAITNGQGFDFIINMVGGKTFEPSLKSLKEFGEMACIASPGQPRVEFSLLDFYRKNLSLYGLNTVLDGVVDSAERLKRLFAEFENKIEKLACLGQTEVMPFLEAKSVLEKALAKELRKPVFRIEEQ